MTLDRRTDGFKHLFDVSPDESWPDEPRCRRPTARRGSLSSHGPVPGLSVYAATKAAVVSLTGSLDSELRGHRIRVHAICPDGVDTRLVADMDPAGQVAALIHSGGTLLTPGGIARHAVGLIGSRRVVCTVPAWRGGMMRLTAAAPSLMMRVEPVLRWQGRRRMRRTAHRPR